MTNPTGIGILIILRLHACVRPYDLSFHKPVTDFSNYPQSAKICSFTNKPIDCTKDASYNLPYASYNTQDRERHLKFLYSTYASPQLQPDPWIRNSMALNGRLDNIPPFNYNPQKYSPSLPHVPNREIYGSIHNSPLLGRLKYKDETITVENEIRHSSDGLMWPSRDMTTVSESTEPLFISKPYEEYHTSINLFDEFTRSLDKFEQKFYQTTFNKLLSISPSNRLDNGISFVQSSMFLYLALVALSTAVDSESEAEIDSNIQLKASILEKIKILNDVTSWLPKSSRDLKFRWATRLVLESGLPVGEHFIKGTAKALRLQVEWLNGTETAVNLTNILNNRVQTDSGGAMRNTFDEDDFSDGVCSTLLNTMYIRARWRSPPTVLNDSRPFRDTEQSPERSVRMITVNDMMRYVFLEEWRAEALEIKYATPDLTLLLLVPQGPSLKDLASNMARTSLREIINKMHTMRVAAMLPIYTLRMTLLLPGKLKEMGISRLVNANNTKSSGCGQLRLSHAVQRLMFWAEAGRNAYKDDGIEWEESPEKEMIVDRPYLFYVRWKNVTIMNGNFVL